MTSTNNTINHDGATTLKLFSYNQSPIIGNDNVHLNKARYLLMSIYKYLHSSLRAH